MPNTTDNEARKSHAHLKWNAWKNAGNEPNRDEALRVYCAHTGSSLESCKNAFSMEDSEGNVYLDSGLSFIYWDITQNGARCLDYDKDACLFRDLLSQARLVIFTYSRVNVKVNGVMENIPTMLSTRTGAKAIADMKPKEFEGLAEILMAEGLRMVSRWKSMVSSPSQVIKILRKMAQALLEEAEAMEAETIPPARAERGAEHAVA